jgi:dTDP-4-amino-4,6-dideoxygalactose transaminase
MNMLQRWDIIMTKWNSWPSGQVPKQWQRPELDALRQAGYAWDDARDAVDIFEKKVAEFAGAKYGVAVDCCSHGLFLSLKYLKASGTVTIPCRTYVSAALQIQHAGCEVEFEDIEWSGVYQLRPYPVWDAATRWRRGMYTGGFHVCSFQMKKRVPIGRGGMILTDDADAYRWLKKASYDGRDLSVPQWEDDYEIAGWHYYMTPEDAARGILLMDQVADHTEDCGNDTMYPDLSIKTIFRKTP